MEVTDLKYNIRDMFVKKLDLMIERCTSNETKKDTVLINEGSEGEGKSNASFAESYYVKYKTGRDIYLFFNLKEMIDFAKSTEKKIIIWDEPALDALTDEKYKTINILLTKLLMTCRIKRHFFIFNFAKFYKFSEYIVVDRATGMIHLFSRKNLYPGEFFYYKRKDIEKLYYRWRSTRLREYFKCARFSGKMPLVEQYFDRMGINVVGRDGKIYNNCTFDDYEREKIKAIEAIGEEKNIEKEKFQKYIDEIKKMKVIIYQYDRIAKRLICDAISNSSHIMEECRRYDVGYDTYKKWKADTKNLWQELGVNSYREWRSKYAIVSVLRMATEKLSHILSEDKKRNLLLLYDKEKEKIEGKNEDLEEEVIETKK